LIATAPGLTSREEAILKARARMALDVRAAEFDLFKFISLHQPRYREPTHMRQLADAFDRLTQIRVPLVT